MKPKDITKIIKTFEDACNYLGINSSDVKLISNSNGLSSLERHLNAYTKLLIIIRALNDGWIADPTKKETWFVPYFYTALSGGGFRLRAVDACSSVFCTGVTARLSFKEKKVAEYGATQFVKEYEEYYMNS